jgi:N-acetylglutamate synthase-like GNAT family acetyltransferase
MAKPPRRRQGAQPYGEKEFYLEEFRGRSVLIAVAPATVATRASLKSLGAAVTALVRNDTLVILWWPHVVPHSERRLLAALGRGPRAARRGHGKRRRLRRRRLPSPVLRVGIGALDVPRNGAALRSAMWSRLRTSGLCVLAVSGFTVFPRHPLELAVALRIPKAVLVDPRGGLDAAGGRLSFVDENVLETVLLQGQAEWSGLGDRRTLLVGVRDALDGGVEQVNLCPPEGVTEELFSYAGSGTLFTEGDYTRVGSLALDEYEQAERLLERGVRDGVLKLRSADEVAQVLGAGFGVTVCGRHLAGVAGLLTAPYAAENAGEIVGLYTINRFKGEGLGDRLVARMVQEAQTLGLDFVFACTVDERAQQFFERQGFVRVGADDVPRNKWMGYDTRRRQRVAVFRVALTARASAAADRAS